MSRLKSKQILFAGQAPVHFLCFRPIYERLRRVPGLTIHLSGEPKISKSKNGNSNGNAGANAGTGADTYELYRPFRVPKESVLPLDQALRGSYTMVFCAHMSGYFPRRDEERVQLFHGLSFRNMGIRRDVLIYDHLFITGPYMMRTFQKARLFRPGDGRCLPIGFPKVDRLVNGTLDRKSILRRLGFSGRRPVLLYAPTGQRQNSLETIGEEVLRRLRAGGRYDILLKLHDHPKDKTIDWPRRLRPLLDTHTRVIRDYDIVSSLPE